MSTKPAEHFQTLVTATSRLIVLMDHEVELLRAMRVSEISDLQTEKQELTVLYEEALQMLADNRIPNGHTLIALQWLALNGDSLRQRWA